MDGLWRFGEEVEESLHCYRSSNPPLPPVKSITLATMSKDASSYPPIKSTNFDLIVLGTGLPESVIAASANGKTVLHMTGVTNEVLRDKLRKGERKKGKKKEKKREEGTFWSLEEVIGKKRRKKEKKKRSKGMCGGEKKRGKKRKKE